MSGKGKGAPSIDEDISFALDRYIPNTGENNYELDLTVCGKDGDVVMIEAMAYEYDETKMGAALDGKCRRSPHLKNGRKISLLKSASQRWICLLRLFQKK